MFEHARRRALAHVFVERSITTPPGKPKDCRCVEESVACLDIHRTSFVEAALSGNGDRIIYHFIAPDVESVRLALHGARICCDSIWIKENRQVGGRIA